VLQLRSAAKLASTNKPVAVYTATAYVAVSATFRKLVVFIIVNSFFRDSLLSSKRVQAFPETEKYGGFFVGSYTISVPG
jgi:hypothetical protein